MCRKNFYVHVAAVFFPFLKMVLVYTRIFNEKNTAENKKNYTFNVVMKIGVEKTKKKKKKLKFFFLTLNFQCEQQQKSVWKGRT